MVTVTIGRSGCGPQTESEKVRHGMEATNRNRITPMISGSMSTMLALIEAACTLLLIMLVTYALLLCFGVGLTEAIIASAFGTIAAVLVMIVGRDRE